MLLFGERILSDVKEAFEDSVFNASAAESKDVSVSERSRH